MKSLELWERAVLYQFDTEDLILQYPQLLNDLADLGYIPRDMFYAYSTQPLIDMESPNQQWPCATFCQDTGNRVRRLDGLMSTGTKIFMPGATGTDEEIIHAFKQALEERQADVAANDNSPYADGTPECQGKIILYNREIMQTVRDQQGHITQQPHGMFDGILQTYGLMKPDRSLNISALETYGIKVVSSLEATKDTVNARNSQTVSWRQKLAEQQKTGSEHMLRRA